MKSMIFIFLFFLQLLSRTTLTFDEFINKSNTILTSHLQSKWNKVCPVFFEDQSEQISQYFEEALKNYEDILNDQQAREVRT